MPAPFLLTLHEGQDAHPLEDRNLLSTGATPTFGDICYTVTFTGGKFQAGLPLQVTGTRRTATVIAYTDDE